MKSLGLFSLEETGKTLLQSTTFSRGGGADTDFFFMMISDRSQGELEQAPQNYNMLPSPSEFKKYLDNTPRHLVWFSRYTEEDKELNSMIMISPIQFSLFCNSMKLLIQLDCFSEASWGNILF